MTGGRPVDTVPGRWGAPLALLAFAGAAAWLGLRIGMPILSYDDVFRTLFAHDWAVRPYFFTERLVWLPFPLALAGLAIRVTGEALWTALGVDLAATGVALWYVHRLAAERFGRLAAWVAASLFGLTPWILFLALSRYGEPVLLATTAVAVLHWARWSASGKGLDLALASLALGAAVLTRYEAWPLGLALPAHVAASRLGRETVAGVPTPRPGWAALWSGLPLLGMGVWVAKNLAVYGRPLYGGAFGFLPSSVPAGPLAGAGLAAEHLWQLSPPIVLLGLAGLVAHRRDAPLLGWLLALSLIVPWGTLSVFPVEVALQVRLLVLPLLLLAPFAGGLVARTVRPPGAALAAAIVVVLVQAALVVRSEYPGQPLPMTRLARQLDRDGTLDRFDAVYVQSPRPVGYPDEVRVATNFRRPIHVLLPDAALLPWADGPAEAILVLTDGGAPPVAAAQRFEVGRARPMVAWGVCRPPNEGADRAEWRDVGSPAAARPGAALTIRLSLRNAGSRPWRPTACGVAVAHRWVGAGASTRPSEPASPLSARLDPGAAQPVAIPVVAPLSPGHYVLEIGLLPHRGAPFAAVGSILRLPVEVSPGAG